MAPVDLLVLYASVTGNAQDVAEQIWRDAKRHGHSGTSVLSPCTPAPIAHAPLRAAPASRSHGLSVLLPAARLYPTDAYDIHRLPAESHVVFVASTTGQGEPPPSFKSFWTFLLQRHLPGTALAGLRFAVFGLGDSAYIGYNLVAKRLFRRIVQLGASPLT